MGHQQGRQVEFSADSAGQQFFERQLSAAQQCQRLAGQAEATGIDAFFAVDTKSGRLRPGELLPLNLALPPQSGVYAVPFQSIYGNSRLYRIVDERLDAVDVRAVGQARSSDGEVWVLVRSDRLQPGDQIAVTHLPNAVTGLKVKARGD